MGGEVEKRAGGETACAARLGETRLIVASLTQTF